MPELKDELEVQNAPELTSEEVRWRMEKVVQYATGNATLDDSALQFNKALRHLKSEATHDEGQSS